MERNEELISLRESAGMNKKQFAEYFDIPYRTLQDWELGNRRMPEYLLRLMSYKVRLEKMAGAAVPQQKEVYDQAEAFSRTRALIGQEALQVLQRSKVAVFGLGGVGGHAAEALARSGVGSFVLVDSDRVAMSNLNRQAVATVNTLGQYKTDAMRQRILEINPLAKVEVHRCFFLPETADTFDFSSYSYVVDAVDTVTAKIALVERAQAEGTPIICSMGAGNKLEASGFRVADIYKTNVCPLAKVMRRELKARGVKHLKVVYSEELPVVKRRTPASIAFVPSTAGLMIAGEVVKDLTAEARRAGREEE